MKITNLIPKEEILSITGDSDKSIIDCTSKYQNAHEDSMLFLLPGVNFDTKELIPKFLASRAKIIVTESKSDILKFDIKNKTIVEVKSSRLAYAYALSKTSDVCLDSLKFIGVTGTNGKTSTATMIAHILEYAGKNVAFIGTGKMTYKDKSYTADNYSMTTPDPEILYPTLSKMQNDGCEIIVMEASSHALELEKLSPIKFDIGIFTGLSQATTRQMSIKWDCKNLAYVS
jgi:UDP-N-acetylmuramoyl-L-alanyl-D-glutamate--2,6-diaminopimelate ligase